MPSPHAILQLHNTVLLLSPCVHINSYSSTNQLTLLHFYSSQSTAVRAAAPAASRNTFALTALIGATSLAYATSNCASSSAAASCEALPVYGIPGTNQERTFLAVKPDGVQRGLIGDIIARFEKRGYKLVGKSNTSSRVALLCVALVLKISASWQ